MNPKTLTLLLSIVLITTLFSGCQEQNSTTKSPYLSTSLDLNSPADQTLNKAADYLANLTDTTNQAQSLLSYLNSQTDTIKEARLSEDGYTIGIHFQDNTIALMMTDDGLFTNHSQNNTNSLPPLGSQITYTQENNKPYTTITTEQFTFTPLGSSANCGGSTKTAPASKKILIINAAAISNPDDLSAVRYARTLFMQHGWDYDDIDIRQRTEAASKDFTPESMLDLTGYGMVFYIGHGGYLSSWPGTIPGHHYLQCCASGNYTDEVGAQRFQDYLDWRDQGQLIRVSYNDDSGNTVKEVYMDTALIAEHAQIDQGAMVYMISCNSQRAGQDFLDAGAATHYGWEGKTNAGEVTDNFAVLLDQLMTNPAQSDQQSYNSLTTDQLTSAKSGGALTITSAQKDNYAPAWGSITVNPTDPPNDLHHYTLEISPSNTQKTLTANPGETLNLEGLIPGTSTITIKAHDAAGNTLETGVSSQSIAPGNNTLSLTNYNTYGIILTAEPTSLPADGSTASEITAELKIWQPTDTTKPTGDPIGCKTITFITDLGTFSSSETQSVDETGQATILLTSEQAGTAHVRAVIQEDNVESHQSIPITFGTGLTLSLEADKTALDGSPDLTTDDSTTLTATVTTTSGEPVANQPVTFTAPWATLQGANPAITNKDGQATITLIWEGFYPLPNPTSARLDSPATISASLNGGTTTDATITIMTDVKDYVTIQLSGSQELNFEWDGNSTFHVTGMNLKIGINDPDNWHTFWRSSSAVAHTPQNYYQFNITKAQRGSTVYLYFEYVNNPTGYIEPTYLHLFNSWIHEIIQLPSYSGTAQDPQGTYSFVIP